MLYSVLKDRVSAPKILMNDSVQHFHTGYPAQQDNGNGFHVNGDAFHFADDDGGAEAEVWREPGDTTDGSWEEPQWDEPRKAESSSLGRSAERLTPGQLRSIVFRRAPLGKRGLDEHQVNSLLDRVEEELTRLTQEKNALASELELLRGYVTDSGQAALPQQQEPQQTQAEGTTPVGRGTGLTRVEPAGAAESQAVAGKMHEAHVYAASLLSQAQQTADQYIQDAQRYSRELVEDARRRRHELLSTASSEHTASGTGAGDESWEREAARVRAANREYRGKLRDYFELLLMSLEEWETAEGVGAPLPSNENENPQ
ncbi:DivIVA domain-containing protein [Nonomuraea polychroma]|uniref:Cell wall synthesis protein Wag31 n=1 Tax=Nonomuraea polychroma TaxID=46176 RepID=A0A438LZ42_9ACTN|nr:DivIVA domain-containing protein [Nonomuraea polychroma]